MKGIVPRRAEEFFSLCSGPLPITGFTLRNLEDEPLGYMDNLIYRKDGA